jgi:hypothetical protein
MLAVWSIELRALKQAVMAWRLPQERVTFSVLYPVGVTKDKISE